MEGYRTESGGSLSVRMQSRGGGYIRRFVHVNPDPVNVDSVFRVIEYLKFIIPVSDNSNSLVGSGFF